MLILTRKLRESIHIQGDIVVHVLAVNGNRVRLGIEAPARVAVRRSELSAVPKILGNSALATIIPAS